MTNPLQDRKKPLLDPELFEENPAWFRGAAAYRLLRFLTPKPLTRRLPRILRSPLLMPGETLPPDWRPPDDLPPGVILPDDIWFPPGWVPGDPLPDGGQIDTTIVFPPGWVPGDSLPIAVTLPPGVTLPPDWTPGDSLPDGSLIDTAAFFPPGWTAGDPDPDNAIPSPDSFWEITDMYSPAIPITLDPSAGGPVLKPSHTTGPAGVWVSILDNTYWNPFRGTWNSTTELWEAQAGMVALLVLGTWYVGYRPTHMRITFTVDTTINVILECPTGGIDPIYDNTAYPLLSEVELTWESDATAHDIYSLRNMWMSGNITNIEFFV